MKSLRRQKGFLFAPMLFAGGVQEVTWTGGVNGVLTSFAGFTALNPARPIVVYLESTFTASSSGGYAFDLGDLSTYAQVDIINNGTIIADGGNGGNSSNGTGGAGGTALNLNSANSSANVSFTNEGTITGGGGGGGGGARYSVGDHKSGTTGGKSPSPTCTDQATRYRGGGGGGGGQTNATYATTGGARTTSTDGCGSFAHGTAGSAGSVSAAGARGTRGYTQYNPDNGSSCGACTTAYGGHGGAGGAWGAAGASGTSGAGGAAGKYAVNRDHVAWTDNGTTHGGYGA